MTVLEIVSIVLNVLLAGGGLVAVVTLRAAKRKADAEKVLQKDAKVMEQL